MTYCQTKNLENLENLTFEFKKKNALEDYSHCNIEVKEFPSGLTLPKGNYDYSVISGKKSTPPMEILNKRMEGSFCNTEFRYCIGNTLTFSKGNLLSTHFQNCVFSFDEQESVKLNCVNAWRTQFYLTEFHSLEVFKSDFAECVINGRTCMNKICNALTLEGSSFIICDFEGWNFGNGGTLKNLIKGCRFKWCKFTLCDLANVEIVDCVFDDCEFWSCNNYSLDALKQRNEVIKTLER